MKGPLSLTVERRPPEVGILRVEGPVDAAGTRQFEAAVQGLDDVRLLVVDMALMTYISSSGLGLLIKAKNDRAKRGGNVALVRPQTSVLNILTIVGLTDLFRIASSVDEALHHA